MTAPSRFFTPILAWRGAILAAMIGLTGCSDQAGFRDQSAQFSATTRFDPGQMQGRWVVQERLAAADDDLFGIPEAFVIGLNNGAEFAVIREHQTCNSWECVGLVEELTATVTGPGRFTLPRDADPAAEHWVLWTDAQFRVAAIGTPSGQFGWIMTRGPVRDDLMQAAREILEWNGYDLALLRPVSD